MSTRRHVMVRTARGDSIDVVVPVPPRADATVGDVIAALRWPPYNYGETVELMFGGRVLRHDRRVDEFPDNTVVVVGCQEGESAEQARREAAQYAATHAATEAAASGGHPFHLHTRAPHARSPQPASGGATAGRSQAYNAHAPARDAGASPTSARPPAGASPTTATPPPSESPRGPAHLLVHVSAPAFQHQVHLTLLETSTVEDLLIHAVAADARLVGAKFVYRGVLLSKPKAMLRELGIQQGAILHAAVGSMASVDEVRLVQIRDQLERQKATVADPAVTSDMKKGVYEDSMRMLFQLDQMQDLPQDLRAKRKELVHEIQHIQDSLGIKL